MAEQLLWIVAVIGAGTLAGTFFKMEGGFGPINLRAIGIVLIAVLASLLGITQADNITAAMGILGAIAGYLFGAEAKEQSKAESSIGVNAENSNFSNARLANTYHETVNNIDRMLGDIKNLTNATIQNLEKLNEKTSKAPLVQSRTKRFSWESSDPDFVAALKSLSRGDENWTQNWIDMCLKEPDCLERIRQIATEGSHAGWAPVEMDFDNFRDGIHVNMRFVREFPLLAS